MGSAPSGAAKWFAASLACLAWLTACAPQPPNSIDVAFTVVAGPVCPVVRDPPEPGCEDRPVEGAELVVVRDSRRIVSVRTDSSGHASVALPAGSYTVQPQPVTGLMGTAAEEPFTVGQVTLAVTLRYDTGIR